MHQTGLNEGKTCIDCHKGIAHTLPEVEQGIGADKHGAPQEIFHPDAKADAKPETKPEDKAAAGK
jgi:cytochrome c-type protein NapC